MVHSEGDLSGREWRSHAHARRTRGEAFLGCIPVRCWIAVSSVEAGAMCMGGLREYGEWNALRGLVSAGVRGRVGLWANLQPHFLRFFGPLLSGVHPVLVASHIPVALVNIIGCSMGSPNRSRPVYSLASRISTTSRFTDHGEVYSIDSSPGQCFARMITLYPASSSVFAVCSPMTPALFTPHQRQLKSS